jgi:ribosomal subunit interface protein
MKLDITGNISLGMSLPSYVEERINQSINKTINCDKADVKVLFTKNGKAITTKIIINEGEKKGILIKSTAESYDIYQSFDMALMKVLSQLRKYKNKIRDYRNKISVSDLPFILAQRSIIQDVFDTEYIEEVKEEKEEIKVVEEKETEIEELTIQEALMKMNLLNLPAFMFINKDNGLINVVYKRPDGLLSWINPKNYKK